MYEIIPLAVNIGIWLLEQAPVIIVMGVIIWWLTKRLEKAEEEKDSLAKDVIKLTTLWEEKSDQLNKHGEKLSEQVLELLQDIRLIVSKIR